MKNNQLSILYGLLYTMPCVNLSIDKMEKVMNLCEDIEEKSKKYSTLRTKIFESYGIKTDDEYYNHEKIDEITKKVTELDLQEVKLKGAKFLSMEEILKCCTMIQNGITPAGIDILKQVLLNEKSTNKPS